MDADIVDFLKACNIAVESESALDGLTVSRDILLCPSTYSKVEPNIKILKKKFSSSSLTCLQRNAPTGQRWPLLNLVRQILRVCGYQMQPVRRSAGYNALGKKLYRRYFLVTKARGINNIGESGESADPTTDA